jgi:hypothetical protein
VGLLLRAFHAAAFDRASVEASPDPLRMPVLCSGLRPTGLLPGDGEIFETILVRGSQTHRCLKHFLQVKSAISVAFLSSLPISAAQKILDHSPPRDL